MIHHSITKVCQIAALHTQIAMKTQHNVPQNWIKDLLKK